MTTFDLVYATIGVVIAGILLAVVGVAMRRSDTGSALAAIGYALILVAGFVVNSLMRSGAIGDAASLQVQFALFYVGFALLLAGTELLLQVQGRRGRIVRSSSYAVACAIGALYLFVPSLAAYAHAGDVTRVSQQVVFYLPLFVGIAIVAIDAFRSRSWRVGAFVLFLLGGVIRESGAIPSFGDAYLDLLGAFVPFTLAALDLGLIAWSRPMTRIARSPVLQ